MPVPITVCEQCHRPLAPAEPAYVRRDRVLCRACFGPQAAAAADAASPPAMASPPPPQSCANCSRIIGKLESAQTFNGEVVCFECAGRLAQQSAGAAPYRSPSPSPISAPSPAVTESAVANGIVRAAVGLFIVLALLGAALAIAVSKMP
ncbi:MAG TPA: hypothetical protein VH253_10985 [Phycisphaerae bacterium]|nr:hypothetical protein [Phycisphaerae bacterium]